MARFQTPRRVVGQRGVPTEIVLDNGPELTGKALDRRAGERGVRLRFVEAWRTDYNRVRPHGALGYRTPEEVRVAG